MKKIKVEQLTKEAFAEEDQPILEFILKHAETINFVNSNSNSNYRYYDIDSWFYNTNLLWISNLFDSSI